MPYKIVSAEHAPQSTSIVDVETNLSILAVDELRDSDGKYLTAVFADEVIAKRVLDFLNAESA